MDRTFNCLNSIKFKWKMNLFYLSFQMDNEPNAPVANPIEQTATDYLQKHRIPDLFHNLSACLVYNKPGSLEKISS